jgi:hypothetical protein
MRKVKQGKLAEEELEILVRALAPGHSPPALKR